MKKIKATFILIVTAVCLLACASPPFPGFPVREKEKSADYEENVTLSLAVYEEAVRPYITEYTTGDGEEKTAYREDYAGVFLDDEGYLNVGRVGDSDSPSDFGGQVFYYEADFSYGYLLEIQSAVTEVLEEYGGYLSGVDEENNTVDVYLKDGENADALSEYLREEKGIDEKAFRCIADDEAATFHSSAYGGESVSRKTGTKTISRGTICVNAVDNATGQLGILTNEHVARSAEGATLSYRGHYDPAAKTFSEKTELGVGSKGMHAGTIDAAFVPFSEQQNWEITPYAKYDSTAYSNVKLGNDGMILQGRPVRKIGQTTGVTDGTITYANTSCVINYGTDDEPDKQTITNVFRYSNESRGGDSGGPVYFVNGNDLYLIGMNFAGPANPDSATYGIGCRIGNVTRELNVTPVTNDVFTLDETEEGVRLERVGLKPSGVFAVPSSLGGKTVSEIGPAAFAAQTKVTSVLLPASVTEIGDQAFTGCTSLTSVRSVGNVKILGERAFAGCSSLTSFPVPAGMTEIGEGAFAGCFRLDLTVDPDNPVYLAEDNVLYDRQKETVVATGRIAEHFTVPRSVSEILPYAFSGNQTLLTVRFEGAPKLGEGAFSDCPGLTGAYFISFDLPEAEPDAFAGDVFTLFVPYERQREYSGIFTDCTYEISSVSVTVTLSVGGDEPLLLLTYFGAGISEEIEPEREGYAFDGWQDGEGNRYRSGEYWILEEDTTVEAVWSARRFLILFSGDGCGDPENKVVVYDQEIGPLPSPSEKPGYTFDGWADERGTFYRDATVWKRTEDLTLISRYRPNVYTVVYDGNGGTPCLATAKMIFGREMGELPLALREGYAFAGWNTQADGKGETVTSSTLYRTAGDTVLYAQYVRFVCPVAFEKPSKKDGTGGAEEGRTEIPAFSDPPTEKENLPSFSAENARRALGNGLPLFLGTAFALPLAFTRRTNSRKKRPLSQKKGRPTEISDDGQPSGFRIRISRILL